MRISLSSKWAWIATASVAMLVWAGCEQRSRPRRILPGSPGITGGASSGDALLTNVVETLNHLDRSVSLELRPPTVLLDASKSRDGRDVMATIGRSPGGPAGPADYLQVPDRNSRFRRIGVRAGDQIRLFIDDPLLSAQVAVLTSERFQQMIREKGQVDEPQVARWIEQEMRGLGETRPRYVELTVRAVQNDSALWFLPGLPIEIPIAQRIEVWRFADEKVRDIRRRLARYVRDGQPSIGWEPSPDEAVLDQLVDRLNQWIRNSGRSVPWQVDPLVETLPPDLRKMAGPSELGSTLFRPYDGRMLEEAIWLRDIARWAAGDSLQPLDRARNLFDWTVRNIQLETRDDLARRPWQAIVCGRGTAEERAWVFLLLCRQEGLDGVMLARHDPRDPSQWIAWLPALWSEGDFYLFDSTLGLPIPSQDGQGVATLSEASVDPSPLSQLNLDPQHPYPVRSEQIQRVAVWIAASPEDLSRRMHFVESRLTGEQRVVLTSDPSALAEKVRASEYVATVGLWPRPFQTLERQRHRSQDARHQAVQEFRVFAWQPALWKARVLHFQGRFGGEDAAKDYYRQSRLPDAQLEALEKGSREVADVLRSAKINASYWLGLLTFDADQPEVAIDYLKERTLEASPDGPWTDGARYNLARAYERVGRPEKARQLYEADDSPQQHGNRLRGRWLASAASQPAAPEADRAAAESSSATSPLLPEDR